MNPTNEQNRAQKDVLDKIEVRLALKRAQKGGDYIEGYNKGYESGKRAAEREIMKQLGKK